MRQSTPFRKFARRDALFESRSASPCFPAFPQFSPCVRETYGRLVGERASAHPGRVGTAYNCRIPARRAPDGEHVDGLRGLVHLEVDMVLGVLGGGSASGPWASGRLPLAPRTA